jgi:hypothetical protein
MLLEEPSSFNQTLYHALTGEKDNDNTINMESLIYENELGGLNFGKETFSVWRKPKRRTGPVKKGDTNLIYEEVSHRLGK